MSYPNRAIKLQVQQAPSDLRFLSLKMKTLFLAGHSLVRAIVVQIGLFYNFKTGILDGRCGMQLELCESLI